MNNIKNDIKTGEYKKVYLLYGTEDYLKKLYCEKLKKAIVPEDDSMNLTVIQGDDFDLNEFTGICDTMPFFADRRLVIVNRCGKFKGSKKSENGNEEQGGEKGKGAVKDAFTEYLKQIPETTVVVFVEDEADKRGRSFKTVKDIGYACEMNSMDERNLILWIQTEIRAIGKSITPETASYLIGWCGEDMGTLKIEMDKLGFYALERDSIEKNDIEAICTKQLKAVIFDLTDAMAVGNIKGAMKVYEGLNALKQPIQMTWRMLVRHFEQLLVVRELRGLSKSPDEIAGSCGIHPYVVKKMSEQGRNFKLSSLRKKLEYGVQLEQDFKSGRIDERNMVELFITQKL